MEVAHVECPICGERVYKTAIWDSSEPGQPDEPGFWGGEGDKRVIVAACYSKNKPWVHFKVNGVGRLAYLQGRAKKRRRKRR